MGTNELYEMQKEVFITAFNNESAKNNECGMKFYGEDEWMYITSIRAVIIDEVIDRVTSSSRIPHELISEITLDLENERKIRLKFDITIELKNPNLFEINFELYNAYTNTLLFETNDINLLSVRVREFERAWNI